MAEEKKENSNSIPKEEKPNVEVKPPTFDTKKFTDERPIKKNK